MDSESELLEKVIMFLAVLVGAILIFNQYRFSRISQSYWNYLAAALILALAALVIFLFASRPAAHKHAEMRQLHQGQEPKPFTFMEKISYGMVALVAVLILFNQMQISQASALVGFDSGLKLSTASTKQPVALTGDPTQDAIAVVIPRGTPFYGEAFGISFDDPIRSLEIIAQLDPSYGRNKVQLSQEEKERYIKIGTTPTMACEFCCGTTTLVFKDGRPACGCKHSWAMRGVAAYLIKNYPDLSDEEIMKEIAKWKSLFFPKQMIQKYIQETQTGQYTPDIASLLLDVDEEKLKEMKAAVASQGNAQNSNTAAGINELPSMVGGC
ncbi:hypothetical protein HYX08_06410 [Candidatus Woesearchaeota archaeon]|nr:hypothetical protein [Candidatus Woesearchaeota archaeon]